MSRQKYNIEILNKLYQYVTDNPDIRLGQALVNMDIVKTVYNKDKGVNEAINPYYEEPENMLKRMNKEKEDQNGS